MTNHPNRDKRSSMLDTIYEHSWDNGTSLVIRYNNSTHQVVIRVTDELSNNSALISIPNGAMSAIAMALNTFCSRRPLPTHELSLEERVGKLEYQIEKVLETCA